MPQQWNNWDIKYNNILFIESALSGHSHVSSFTRTDDILFTINRRADLSTVVALLVNRYTIGLADVLRAVSEFPDLTCIVAHGTWSGYTRDAKKHGLKTGVGVFNAREFLGALSRSDPLTYVQRWDDGEPAYAYHTAYHTVLFVFGSALHSPSTAQDFDVLAIYDRARVLPSEAYDVLAECFRSIATHVGLPVHATVLTEEEASQERFIERFGCVPLLSWIGGDHGLNP